MLTFLSVAFSIYGAMHLYALSKVWLALPHSFWMSTALAIAGLLMTVSPLLLYQISKQNWHETAFAMGINNEIFPIGFKSSQLSVRQMSDLIEVIYAYGAKHNVKWSEKYE